MLYIDLQLINEPNLIGETIASYLLKAIPYLSEALKIDESIVSAMILKWNERLGTDKIEARQHLVRKIVETGAKFSDSLDDNDSKNKSESTFETLAKQLDIYGMYADFIILLQTFEFICFQTCSSNYQASPIITLSE